MSDLDTQSHLDAVPEDVYSSWSASPAPDGQHVAFVSDRSGEPTVWLEGPQPRRLARLAVTMPWVITVSWSPDGAWLACLTTAPGSSRTEVWLVRPDGTGLHLAAGHPPGTAVLGAGPWHGWSANGRLLITETTGVTSSCLLIGPDGTRQDISSGPLQALLDHSPASGRALVRVGPRGDRRLVLVEPDGREIPVVTGSGNGSVDRACLSPDGRTVFARSDVGRELAALVSVTVGSDQPRVVAQRMDAELEDVVLAADGTTAVLLWNINGGLSSLSLLDVATSRQEEVLPLPRDVVDECRLEPDGKTLLLTAQDWADPRGVWTIDLVSGEATPLSSRADGELRGSRGASAASVDTADLTRPVLRRFRAPDGLQLTGWLYRPEGEAPWPAMIHLHGGPEAQERPIYNSLFQSLVAAGIAVFAPNVRGSSGFGRSFVTADDGAKRWAAIQDVVACLDHLVRTDVADPERVGVMGRSYGGYLTLAALVWHPELFTVGIDVCGMADFHTFYEHTEPWIASAAYSKYGHPVEDSQLLRDLSPIHRIDALRAPLLVVHGADDTNVPVEEAEQVVAALTERGVEHRYLVFPGEGHELMATPNRVAFVQAAVAWVQHHIG
jgi:dipeptidyl aminopeptidase/acylaminoacyl peptidase